MVFMVIPYKNYVSISYQIKSVLTHTHAHTHIYIYIYSFSYKILTSLSNYVQEIKEKQETDPILKWEIFLKYRKYNAGDIVYYV